MTVWIIETSPVYWKSILVSQREYLLHFCHGREEFVEEEKLEEDDVEPTKNCNWLCSVHLTEEDKLRRNGRDRIFTARFCSNKWARTRRSGLLWRQRQQRQWHLFKRNSASKHFFSFSVFSSFFFYICTEDAQSLSEHCRCDTQLQSRLKK